MDLNAALSIATSGLYAVDGQINVASQNIANANTAGYTDEVAANQSVVAGDQVSGVRIGAATRVTAPALQTSLYAQNAVVAYQTTLSNAYSAVTSVEGSTSSSTGSSGSLSAYVSTLQSDFTALDSNPSSSVQQQVVVNDASALATGVQSLASTYATQRQAASDSIGSSVANMNQQLGQIGSLSHQIASLRVMGESTAGLEDQRQGVMTQLSSEIGVKFQEQPNGNMLVTTSTGLSLPTNATTGPFSYAGGAILAGDSYNGSPARSTVPGILLDGQDVTSSLTGGTIGANIMLRDTTLPTDMAELDSFSSTVAQRFASQGLSLFTDGSGTVPAATALAVGFSTVMQVNPTVLVSPSLVVSGTAASASSVVASVLNYTFGLQASNGVPQPVVATTGLGVSGTLSIPYSGTGTLSDFAANLTAAQGNDAANAADELTTQTAVQSALQTNISSVSSVSIDSEVSKMTALQNTYTANAKVIAAVQAMFTSLLAAVS